MEDMKRALVKTEAIPDVNQFVANEGLRQTRTRRIFTLRFVNDLNRTRIVGRVLVTFLVK